MKLLELLRILRFASVGAVAAAVHFLSVILMVETDLLTPLIANVFGFLIAFWVSYYGHRFWTFGDQTRAENFQHRRSFLRFFLTACAGFVLNECLFFVLMKYLHLSYPLVLFIAVGVVAASTYLLSRRWAFKAQA